MSAFNRYNSLSSASKILTFCIYQCLTSASLLPCSRDPQAPSIEKMKSPRGAYDYAAFMGKRFGADSCEELFHTCEASYQTMITYVAKLRA